MQQRPTGVTILAVMAIIGGIGLLLTGGWFLITEGGKFMAGDTFHGGMGVTGAAGAIVLALFFLGLGIGLWRLKPWAWFLSLAVAGLLTAFGLLRVMARSDLGMTLVYLTIAGVMFWYLFRPVTKMAFGRR